MAIYRYQDKIFSIVPCVKEDIPSHIERVLSYWKNTGTNLESQLVLLNSCVEAKTAFKIIDQLDHVYGYCYWKPIDTFNYITYLFWFKNGTIYSMLLDYMYKHTTCKTAYFMPHQRQRISYRSSLIDNEIYNFYHTHNAVKINIRNYKLQGIHDRYFTNKVIEV